MNKDFFLFDVDYLIQKEEDQDVGVIRLFGKTEEDKSICVIDKNFDPYFYAVPKQDKIEKTMKKIKDIDENGLKIKDMEKVEKTVNGEKKKAIKVYTYSPPDTSKLRDIIKKFDEVGKGNCYEYSISFYKQYSITKDIKPGDWISVKGKKLDNDWDFDTIIECENLEKIDKKGGPQLDILSFDLESYTEGGKDKIIMLSLYSDNWKKVLTYREDKYPENVELLGNEKELIERFIQLIKKKEPDVLVSYNGDEFDFKILRKRVEDLNLELPLSRDNSNMEFVRRGRISAAKLKGRLHIDLYNFINNILSPQLQTEVLTLDAVASEILGEKKLEMNLEDILESWRKEENLKKMTKYCLKDSELTFKLGEVLIPQIFELSKVSGELPFDSNRMSYGQLVEWFLIRRAHPEKIVPDRPKWEEIKKRGREEPFKGGFVKEPVTGIHENISVLDFKSLYPTIMVTYNISPETLNCECCKEEGHKIPGFERWFCKNKKGFIPEILEELIKQRTELKAKMDELDKDSSEYKALDNRQYAIKIISNSFFGYTGYSGARWYCKECAESITALGRNWINKVMKNAEEEGFKVIYGDTDSLMLKNGDPKSFLEKINEKLPGMMQLELENTYKRGIFISKEKGKGAKKRYAMIDNKGNLKITGLEIVRRDWSNLAKKLQRKILTYVLRDNNVNKAKDYVKDVVEKVKRKEVDLKDLIIYTELKKPLEKYKSKGPHVAAAEKMKKKGKPVGEGMVVMYVITEGKGSISERAEPFEVVSIDKIDTKYYIHHQIISVALRVLKVLGVDKAELLGEGEQKSLKSFD